MSKQKDYVWYLANSKIPERIAAPICILLATIITLVLIPCIFDVFPATEEDFCKLESYASEIELNPSLLLDNSINYVLQNGDDKTTIIFENDECKVIATYSKNFSLVDIKREDHYMGDVPLVFVTLATLFIFYFLMIALFIFVCYKLIPIMLNHIHSKIESFNTIKFNQDS